ncbi:MAG TPA: 23S rRNA (adenine(2503)-C(2))-methyltransferase RlmN [Patescibacteria group bacterium]|nr:23S rRNA (adenine(2503)-C(2))-methyltransferase RlmN [Patescibacteria group bacterium]
MIEQFAKEHNLPSFRLNQFYLAFYGQAISSFDELTTWPIELREELKANLVFSSLTLEKLHISSTKDTYKALMKRVADGQYIEAVLMRHKDGRNTVCVSCMVGCPVGCVFCATGRMGFLVKLSAQEIVDQVLFFQRLLKKEDVQVSQVVFMGMGEPMLNLEEVEKAVAILTDPKKFGMSDRRITVSSSGYVPQLETLFSHGFGGQIAISLHAPSQKLRETLMPVAKVYPLEILLKVLDTYTNSTHKRVSYEYVLLKGVNDQEEHALELSRLLCGKSAHVNLIPYNPIPDGQFERPSRNQARRFQEILTHQGISSTIRVTMGDEIHAACGQLATQKL